MIDDVKRSLEPEHADRPVVPTEFAEHFVVNGIFMQPGWYAAKIRRDGVEGMRGVETRFAGFDQCKAACDVHNKWIGMSEIEIAQLYAQRRLS